MHVTAMQAIGAPPIAPSTSQNGNAGSLHAPSAHDLGFGVVHAHPSPKKTTSQDRRHMRQFLISDGCAVERFGTQGVPGQPNVARSTLRSA